MEHNRFEQNAKLRAAGWFQDAECEIMRKESAGTFGGPIYMRSPDGYIYAVSGGTERRIESSLKQTV